MLERKHIFGLPPVVLVILLMAIAKFSIHLFRAPGYGFFGDELYTIALSKHLAFGYVDLPPLVPALMALSRALLGESLLAMQVFPALAGSVTLIFTCLITREFGGKTFAVALSGLTFIAVPIWLGVHSIFCYDSIDQLVLAAFLYVLVRFLRTGERKLWLVLGTLAGIACMTKMTIPFLAPGFLVALLLSGYRRDLLTPWPWLGAVLCLLIVSPYLIWQFANHWPSLEYWRNYAAWRVYDASVGQYLTNILAYMGVLLLPLWMAGLYRIFRQLDGTNYAFLGLLFFVTVALLFALHASIRLLAELFIPLLAAGCVFVEEKLAGIRWKKAVQIVVVAYLSVASIFAALFTLPIVPPESLPALMETFSLVRMLTVKEFKGTPSYYPLLLAGRLEWDTLVRDVAKVYHGLPPQERAVAGIYTDMYMSAGAIDLLGPQYGLPHAVSGSLTYYLWGPGYSWDVMIVVTSKTNELAVFFEENELQPSIQRESGALIEQPNIYVCRKPKVPADVIWSSLKLYR
ncbi:MAG: glycosyltransferase family 39 protein [Chloroflexota bacterium]